MSIVRLKILSVKRKKFSLSNIRDLRFLVATKSVCFGILIIFWEFMAPFVTWLPIGTQIQL